MLMMISPAKKLEMEAPAAVAEFGQPALIDRAAELVDMLRTRAPEELAALMKISPALAELNARRFAAWQTPFSLNNAKQALFAFRGDVYASLDADTLAPDSIDYAQRHLRILSGLYGLLRPLDLMQAYRLEMGTRLAGGHGRDLYAYWGDTISRALDAEMAGHKEQTLVNLASGEYAKAVDPRRVRGRWVNIHFKEKKDGGLRVIGIHAKRARGLMCRYAMDHKVEDPMDLQGFDSAGYQYRAELSTPSDWVFAR